MPDYGRLRLERRKYATTAITTITTTAIISPLIAGATSAFVRYPTISN